MCVRFWVEKDQKENNKMTRMEIIQQIEQHCAEIEADLSASKLALVALRGAKKREGPIVYGSKVKQEGHTSGTRTIHGSKTREIIADFILNKRDGASTIDIANYLSYSGIPFNRHTIHNALSRIPNIEKSGSTISHSGQTVKIYKIREKSERNSA